MKLDFFGKLYVTIMSGYFVVSGFNALWDIDEKLARIGLNAVDFDGKIAFILIYCSLMVGIGVSIAALFYFTKTWVYPAVLATIILFSFIVFRIVGSYLAGTFSDTQIMFLLTEIGEVSIGLFLIIKSGKLRQSQSTSST